MSNRQTKGKRGKEAEEARRKVCADARGQTEPINDGRLEAQSGLNMCSEIGHLARLDPFS